MFASRSLRLRVRPSSAAAAARLFSSSPKPTIHVPSIRDITPESTAEFNARQKEFRESLAEASRKSKENTPSSRECHTVVVLSIHSPTLTLGCSGDSGPLSSLIYGSNEAREHFHELERSFSEVISRGKYVHSLVFHHVQPDRVGEYVEAIGNWYPHVANIEENKVHLLGSWRTQVGDNDTFGRILFLIHRKYIDDC